MRYSWPAAILAGVAALGIAACGSSSDNSSSSSGSGSGSGGSITGAGATFPQPLYTQLASQAKGAINVTVNYQGVGSGAGVAQFTAKTVDFGASDPPLKPEETTAAEQAGGTPVVEVPTALGAITVSYNLSGIKTGLKLDGPTVAEIFAEKVKNWDDPRIADQNPGVTLPNKAIGTCHRSDSSGTTKNFTAYLAIYDSTWEKSIGVDKSVKWPGGTGAKGNDGVAACVKQSEGSVGYVEEAYALQNNFTAAAIKNKSGNYIAPSLESTTAAADGVSVKPDNTFDPVDSPNAQAYPITSTTYLLLWQDGCKAGQSKTTAGDVQEWAKYVLSNEGQDTAKKVQYAPLPSAIQAQAQKSVDGLQCNGSAL